jgi:peptidoglycan/xylan/chitin deacetylase (PgdA/CDA1 family)
MKSAVFSLCLGIILTIDLCPSSKPLDANLFNYLEALGHNLGKPVPVAIAVSGKWIERHEKELEQLKQKYLAITWVNHSYSHPVEKDYLNNPKVDFTYEVKHNLEVMKKHGLKPSKYFRFPGLRHNAERLAELKAMGYLNLNADAWLGKGQPIKNGSIVLIHGNGNEKAGVVDKFIAAMTRAKWTPVKLP